MIIPLGHAESSTRRLPWVTIGIMLACLLVFLATDDADFENFPDRTQMLQEAEDYWRSHAYLDAAPEIRTRVAYDVMPNQRTQYLALMVDQSLGGYPETEEELAAEQAELDRLTGYALGGDLPPETADQESANPYRRWGFVPAAMGIVGLLAHMFMHVGWFHLLSNLFLLFLAGPPVEDRLGRPLFSAFYLAAGSFAALFWAMLTPDPNIALVGASGAISGVLGAFFIRFWNTNIRFGYFFMVMLRPYFGTFEAKAWVMLPLWFASEILQGYLAHSMGITGGVAYWAHVGGFIFGTGCVLVVHLTGLEEKFIDARIEAKVTLAESNPRVEEAMAAQESGDPTTALTILQEAFAADPGDRDVALALWDAARAVDDPELGSAAMLALIRGCATDADKGLAIAHWIQLTSVLPTALADPGSLIRLVPGLVDDGNPELAVVALRHAVDPDNTGLTPGIALRAADLAGDLDPPAALLAFRAALESPDLHEAKRARIAATVEALEAQGVAAPPSVAEVHAEALRAAADREIEIDTEEEVYGAMPIPVAASLPMAAASSGPPSLPHLAPPPLPTMALASDGDLVAEVAGDEVPPPLPIIEAEPPPLAPLGEPEAPAAPLEESQFAEYSIEELVAGPRFSDAKIVDAVPSELGDAGLRIVVSGGRKAKVDYAQISGVAVAVVRDISPKPVLLIDLLLNWAELDESTLCVIRIRSNAFDPRSVDSESSDAMTALKSLVDRILEGSGAIPLPDGEAARGAPYAVYADLNAYEREVLQIDR